MSQVFRLKSLHPYTEFSPSWDIPIYHNYLQDEDTIDTVRNWLIENEQRFLDLPVHNDGGTGLGEDSVTSRFSTYHLFDYIDELPELKTLLDFFRFSYVDFMDKETTIPRELDFMCWFNILRPGQKINVHKHGSGPDVYLSGNMHLDNYSTETFYMAPIDNENVHIANNLKGGLTLFPSYVEHGTTDFGDEGLRLSIAFDLRLPYNSNNDMKNILPFVTGEQLHGGLYSS